MDLQGIDLKKFLKIILVQKDMKTKEFCDKLGISISYLSLIINKKRNLTNDLIERMSTILELDDKQKKILQDIRHNSYTQIVFNAQNIDEATLSMLIILEEKYTALSINQIQDIVKILEKE